MPISRTADNYPAAVVGDTAYALIAINGQSWLTYRWLRSSKPIEQLTAADFQLRQRMVDENEFAAEIADLQAHVTQERALDRVSIQTPPSSIWGTPQMATQYGPGIILVSTAGHGGFILTPERNHEVHSAWRDYAGNYEHDCDWAIIAHTFPELFTERERRQADQTLRNWRPHEYQLATGLIVETAESRELRRQAFERLNAANLVVIAAQNDPNAPGMVECTATRGGDRRATARKFLVPAQEYERRSEFGFLIDETVHQPA